MEKWETSLRGDRYRHQRENPSFSSTLLDAIYRSIDESNGDEAKEKLIFYRETMWKKHGNVNGYEDEGRKEEIASLQRACMIEKWMGERVSYEKVAVRKSLGADFGKKDTTRKEFDSVLLNSSSSSSESSYGGSGFSSSESESTKKSSCTKKIRPKPIRTIISAWTSLDHQEMDMYQRNNSCREGGGKERGKQDPQGSNNSYVQRKSKASKIYGDLKKVKQPVSPGGRLASFLNSLFTAGNAKKAKISSRSDQEYSSSTCSSASSFSRSCLSKTPSSRGKLSNNSNGAKRSVRFCPVSVIVDEDSRPCGHKTLYGSIREEVRSTSARNAACSSHPTKEELKYHLKNQTRRAEEVARDGCKNYQKKKQDTDMRDSCIDNEVCSEEDEEEDVVDDDDIASCASSDLFELDNLAAIGIEHRYSEELPVFETTHLGCNLAIANGLIV